MPPKRTSPKSTAGPKLLIVESPAKCKKIQEFLGAGWRVRATMGHIRALKEDLSAIGFRTTWTPTYEAIGSKADAIAALRREAAAASQVYLGSDDDREGEAIAWHTCILLGLDPATTPRVTFHEITAAAITAAVASPGHIDMNKFNAQQARTMLDMLIGFTLSPCLWKGVGNKPGLSAGRCQTPALRIIYDRDQEIAGHTASLSWRLTATTVAAATATATSEEPFVWRATEDLPTEATSAALLTRVAPAPHTLTITNRQERVATSSAPLPFITSTLQQEASSRLGLNPKTTMRAAQTLYEAGHITYMRTDNAVLSEEAKEEVAALVTARWGADYLAPPEEGGKKKVVRRKKAAAPVTGGGSAAAPAPEAQPQAAHEGIRPTHLENTELTDQDSTAQSLYELIWRRTVQSQMAPERRDVTKLTATFTAAPEATTLTTEWDRQAFAGWKVLDAEKKADEHAADFATYEARRSLTAGQALPWTTVTASELRSSAPSRYTEASLIRELEARGIGRPSTYATLVETVMDRGYVEKVNIPATPVTLRSLTLTAGSLTPAPATRTERAGAERDKLRTTALGRTVIEWLLSQFEDMVAYDFTAAMEAQLDQVAKGARFWQTLLTETWDRYKDRYDAIMATPAASTAATGGGGASATTSDRVANFGDGYKMVISKKGPLFVLEQSTATPPVRFAPVPAHLSITTATRADAEAAFATAATARTGESLGEIEGEPVLRRSGKFGPYVTWRGHSVNCKSTDTLSDVSERLIAKANPTAAAAAVDHLVGSYRIRRGPYGLYMFKVTAPGATKKPVFVGIPESTPWSTLTPETAEQVYKLAVASKKAAPSATATETKKPRAPRKKAAGATDD